MVFTVTDKSESLNLGRYNVCGLLVLFRFLKKTLMLEPESKLWTSSIREEKTNSMSLDFAIKQTIAMTIWENCNDLVLTFY